MTGAPARRRIGLAMTTALVVGNIIGSAAFMLPVSLAPYGWTSLPGWGLSLVGGLALAWVFAALSRALPTAGGAFGFMRMGVGDGAAFLGAWGYWISCVVANAAIALGGTSYLSRLFPAVGNVPGGVTLTSCVVLWGLTWVNLRGIRTAGMVQMVTTILKLLPFIAVLAVALLILGRDGTTALPPVQPEAFTWGTTTGAAAITLYSLLGLESAAVPADRVERPERTIPLATMFGTAGAALVTVLCCSAVVLMLPTDVVANSPAPLSAFVAGTWGEWAGNVVAIGAVISAYGCLNGWVLLTGELPAAMADSGTLPSWWGERNAADAPRNALLVSSVVGTALLIANSSATLAAAYTFVILLSTATNLPLYLLTAVSALRLGRAGTVRATSLLTLCAVVAIGFTVWALIGAGRDAVLWGVALTAAGWPLYRLMRRRAEALA